MFEYKKGSNEQAQKIDQNSTTDTSLHPAYLDSIKHNLQLNLPSHTVTITPIQDELQQNSLSSSPQFSLLITSQTLYRQKYQLVTQSFMDQMTYIFSVRHLITVNHRQVSMNDRVSNCSSIRLMNKINQLLQNMKLIIDVICGKVYFQTKSFIDENSLRIMRKKYIHKDCFYTEIVYTSIKMAQRYIDLVLFVVGDIDLKQLLRNLQLGKEFTFLVEAHEILERLEKSVAFIGLWDYNEVNSVDIQQESLSQYNHNLHSQHQHQHHPPQPSPLQQYQLQLNHHQITSSLQYFTPNTQHTITLFTPHKNLYSNIDLTVNHFNCNNQIQKHQKIFLQQSNQLSSCRSKQILSYIEIVNVEDNIQSEGNGSDGWRLLSMGGFGVIQVATVSFKNLSTSYRQPDTGYQVLVRQQLIRKQNKHEQKNKIKRQRNILQKLQYFSHPNIMSFYISFQPQYENCIFADYTPNMSLDLWVDKNKLTIPVGQRLNFMLQAIEGLLFLHKQQILHLDIKPGNMLISKRLQVQLSDFGEAFLIQEDNMKIHQHAYTIPYCAPEIFNDPPQLTPKVDVYAIGVCILKIVLGEMFLTTYLKKKFVQRLCKNDISNYGIGEKFQNSFLSPIFKIVSFIAHKTVNVESSKRPGLEWIKQILQQCRDYILVLIY